MRDAIVATSSSNLLGGDTIRLNRVNEASIARVKESIYQLSCNARSLGLSDSDILLELGRGRDTFDLFGVFCNFWGRMMQFLGVPITVAISLFSAILFVEWVVARVHDIGEWLKSLIGGIPMFFAHALLDKEKENDVSDVLGRITSEGLKGFIYGLLPPPFSMALGAIIGALNLGAPPVQGPPQTSGAPSSSGGILGGAAKAVGSGLSLAQTAEQALTGAIPGAIDKIIGLLGGHDEDVEFDEDEINGLAAATGRSSAHIRKRLENEARRRSLSS